MAANVSAQKSKKNSVFNCQPLLTKPQTFKARKENMIISMSKYSFNANNKSENT